MIWSAVIVFSCCGMLTSHAANILAVFPVPSYSHQIVYRNLMLELNKRGHNITVATPNPVKDPNLTNYKEIDLSYGYDFVKRSFTTATADLKIIRNFPEVVMMLFRRMILDLCELYLSDPILLDLYKRNEKFDLFILEWGTLSCVYPFEKLADGKVIGITSFQLVAINMLTLGYPVNPVLIADPSLGYSNRMTLLQRIRATIFFFAQLACTLSVRLGETSIARRYFGPDVPSLLYIDGKVSLVFDNSHVALGFPMATSANFIPLGGPPFHIIGKQPEALPKDLKIFLDNAPEGVIYFSLGTNVKTNNMSSEEEILLESFKKLKQKVLWKWENNDLVVNLKNVRKEKWIPQIGVLAHPNVKAFVTQGGLQSISEAIHYKVPMIVMPFFADQNHNARKMEAVGAAKYMDFDAITVETFTEALNDLINNKTYKENIIKFSNLVNDQPIPPLEKAVWWTEYVIRHNGAPHLRSPAATMPWYKFLNLDVLVVLLLIVSLFIYVVYFVIKLAIRMVFKSNKRKKE